MKKLYFIIVLITLTFPYHTKSWVFNIVYVNNDSYKIAQYVYNELKESKYYKFIGGLYSKEEFDSTWKTDYGRGKF